MANLVKKVMDVAFDKKRKPSMFLANFFKVKELDSIKVEVQGRTVKSIYSVDVKLGTGGRRMDLSAYEKQEFVVPEYNDYATITEEDMFKVQFGETEYTTQAAKMADLITDRQTIISDAQRRAEEKQAADAFFNGMVVLADGTKIEYNKKQSHSIDKTSAKWTNNANNPIADITNACELCQTDGKIGTSTFHLILESKGLNALLSNTFVKENSDYKSGIKRTDISMPVEMTPGATLHGSLACGSFLVYIWTYNEKYEIPTGYGFDGEGTEVGYIKQGGAILLPENPNFVRYYGALNNVDASNGNNMGGAKLSLQKAQQMPYAYDVVKGGSAITEAGVSPRPLYLPCCVGTFSTSRYTG